MSASGPETAEDYSNARVPAEGAGRAGSGARAVRAGLAGFIAVPLVTGERVLGAITFGADHRRSLFTEEDVDIALELGQQVALVAARAERFEAEYRASHVLQAGLLPPLPPPVHACKAKLFSAGQLANRPPPYR